MLYRISALGVSIVVSEGQDVEWFVKQALQKGAQSVSFERIEECSE